MAGSQHVAIAPCLPRDRRNQSEREEEMQADREEEMTNRVWRRSASQANPTGVGTADPRTNTTNTTSAPQYRLAYPSDAEAQNIYNSPYSSQGPMHNEQTRRGQMNPPTLMQRPNIPNLHNLEPMAFATQQEYMNRMIVPGQGRDLASHQLPTDVQIPMTTQQNKIIPSMITVSQSPPAPHISATTPGINRDTQVNESGMFKNGKRPLNEPSPSNKKARGSTGGQPELPNPAEIILIEDDDTSASFCSSPSINPTSLPSNPLGVQAARQTGEAHLEAQLTSNHQITQIYVPSHSGDPTMGPVSELSTPVDTANSQHMSELDRLRKFCERLMDENFEAQTTIEGLYKSLSATRLAINEAEHLVNAMLISPTLTQGSYTTLNQISEKHLNAKRSIEVRMA